MSFAPSEDTPAFEHVISVVNDDACRKIIATLERPMTTQEIATAAGLPVSTTYKKLDVLTSASLVRETVSVRHERHQEARYVLNFEAITITQDETRSLRVDIERRLTHSFQELLAAWGD